VTADAFPGTHFAGKVTRIAAQGAEVSNVVTFDVKIEVTSPNKSLLKPVMTANVSILVDQAKNTLLVPVAAVFHKDGKTTVTVVNAGGKTHEQPVTTGITDNLNWQILSGLHAGQTVKLQSNGYAQSRWH